MATRSASLLAREAGFLSKNCSSEKLNGAAFWAIFSMFLIFFPWLSEVELLTSIWYAFACPSLSLAYAFSSPSSHSLLEAPMELSVSLSWLSLIFFFFHLTFLSFSFFFNLEICFFDLPLHFWRILAAIKGSEVILSGTKVQYFYLFVCFYAFRILLLGKKTFLITFVSSIFIEEKKKKKLCY